MDHREFLAQLSSAQRQTLMQKTNQAGLIRLISHWGFIVLCALLISLNAPFKFLWMLIAGILLVFLFTLLHEASHRTPFKSLALNKAVAWVCGFLLFLPASWFRYFHFEHHRHTQDPERDPELAEAKPQTRRQYFWHISGLPIWRGHFKTLWNNAGGNLPERYIPDSAKTNLQNEARAMCLLYAVLLLISMLLSSALLLEIWIIPLLLGQPFLRLYLLAEHADCPAVQNMFANTRTTLSNGIVRWFAWNMPYHAEHHAYPAVPFHKLPLLHEWVKPHLQVVAHGYWQFNEQYARKLTE